MDEFNHVHECVGHWTDDGEWQVSPGEPIVRCKDCERFAVDQSDHDYRTGWWCKRWYTDMVKPDGFCAWACRKEQQ